MRRLGIQHWSVVVNYDLRRSDGDFTARGECVWHVDYNKATISLDPDSFSSEADVAEVFRHELFHLVLAPFSIFLNAVKPLMKGDEAKADMAESIWEHASEMAVIGLERMYAGLTEVPPKLKADPKPEKKRPRPPRPPAGRPRHARG
jgi:hypothetical protein